MKGNIFNPEQFDPIVYGAQTLFIKTFSASLGQLILHTHQEEPVPFTVDSKGAPFKQVNPHFQFREQFYIKEDWRVISILSNTTQPHLSGRKAVMYTDDMNLVLSAGELQNGVNSFLYTHPLTLDTSIPGFEFKSSQPMTVSSMPSWAARYGFVITSAVYKHLGDITLSEAINATGNEQITLAGFRESWNSKAKRSQTWEANPVIGLYAFDIITLNGYAPTAC